MHDFEHVDAEELAEIKLWLFQENLKLDAARQELDQRIRSFEKEKEVLLQDIKDLEIKNSLEARQLQNEKMLFEKRWQILQRGFDELNQDRLKMERERRSVKKEPIQKVGNADMLFSGVDNSLALKKRYRDLLKIFHPDNLAGDHDTVQLINREYEILKKGLF